VKPHAHALILVAAIGCSDGNPRVEPRLDLPPAGTDADPFAGVDELRLSVAESGHAQSLLERTVALGEALSLTDVPFRNDLVIHLRGLRDFDAEVSYGRTCAFDATGNEISVVEPRLYFSRIAAWGTGPSPVAANRAGGHALSAPDGSALFVGGAVEVTALERFDPLDTGDFSELATTAPRVGAAVAELGVDEGRWVVVGGVDSEEAAAANAVAVVELIEWRPGLTADRMVTSRAGPRLRGHAAATLVDGSVVVVGGESQTADGAPFAATAKAWTIRDGAGGDFEVASLAAELATARHSHSLTRLGSEAGADLLVVGGRDVAGDAVASAELYRPLSRTFETVDDALLGTPRWSHAAVRMPGGFVLVLGGLAADPLGGDPIPVAEMELYDPVQGRFSPAGSLPAAAGVIDMTVTLLPDGRVLLAGGLDAGGQPSHTVHIARLDPIDGQVFVSPTSDLAHQRAGHSAVPLCDGTVLVVGGNSDPVASGAERYSPPPDGRE